jgi:hypothetical protein
LILLGKRSTVLHGRTIGRLLKVILLVLSLALTFSGLAKLVGGHASGGAPQKESDRSQDEASLPRRHRQRRLRLCDVCVAAFHGFLLGMDRIGTEDILRSGDADLRIVGSDRRQWLIPCIWCKCVGRLTIGSRLSLLMQDSRVCTFGARPRLVTMP